jgi:hypothetical protein
MDTKYMPQTCAKFFFFLIVKKKAQKLQNQSKMHTRIERKSMIREHPEVGGEEERDFRAAMGILRIGETKVPVKLSGTLM